MLSVVVCPSPTTARQRITATLRIARPTPAAPRDVSPQPQWEPSCGCWRGDWVMVGVSSRCQARASRAWAGRSAIRCSAAPAGQVTVTSARNRAVFTSSSGTTSSASDTDPGSGPMPGRLCGADADLRGDESVTTYAAAGSPVAACPPKVTHRRTCRRPSRPAVAAGAGTGSRSRAVPCHSGSTPRRDSEAAGSSSRRSRWL